MAQAIVRIVGAGTAVVNGVYHRVEARTIPAGFTHTCNDMGWEPQGMWAKLSDQVTPWYLHENGSYLYLNIGDGQWWIDEPSGAGVYVAKHSASAGNAARAVVGSDGSIAAAVGKGLPPVSGWRLLQGASPPAPRLQVE